MTLDDSPDTIQHTIYWWDHETGDVHHAADDFADLSNRDITMQCTGAAKPAFFNWTITCRGPVIEDVRVTGNLP
jgi:hypothetical protein